MPDLIQSESAILGACENRQAVKNAMVIAPLSAGSRRFGQQAYALVVSDRRSPQTGLFRYFTDGHDQRLSLAKPSAEVGPDELLHALSSSEPQPKRAMLAFQTEIDVEEGTAGVLAGGPFRD